MAIPPQIFPPRKRRPSPTSFISPNLTQNDLLHSLFHLSKHISSLKPLTFLHKKNSISLIRKSHLLNLLFEHLITKLPSLPSLILCFDEMYLILHRIKTLLEDSSNGSKTALLLQNDVVADSFRKITSDLSTLLDIFPLKDLHLNDDVFEIVLLIRKQCYESKNFVDPKDKNLRDEVLAMLEGIKQEIIPDRSKLAEIFQRLDLKDSSSCRSEIESLEDETHNRSDENSKSNLVALIGLVRYAKCVLYGASSSTAVNLNSGEVSRRREPSEMVIPADFRCPITLELMKDPVVVATGQTYDRDSIRLWIESGHDTCPKTGQRMAHTELIPNLALKNLIAMWCREEKILFDNNSTAGVNVKPHGVIVNKAALEATRMTALYLVNRLTLSMSVDDVNGVVYELRVLAKTDSDSRACIAEAEAIPLLVSYLGSENHDLQVNAVTTILNLSILEVNKKRIMETDGAVNGVIGVLLKGATWEAKANAAATIFSLCGVHAYRRRLGRKARVMRGLVDLARCGPAGARRDALVAIMTLGGDREMVGRLVECGVVGMVVEVMEGTPDEAVAVLEVVVRRGGLVAVAAAFNSVRKLGALLRDGSDGARESAAATLATMCRKGGSDVVAELAGIPGIERVIWELMAIGSPRGKRKAATLLRILRRWAAGLDGGELTDGFSTAVISSTTMVSTQ